MKKNKINLKDIKLEKLIKIFMVVIFFAIIVSSITKNKKTEEVEIIEPTEEEIEIEETENITKFLETLEERERMEYYFGMFLGYIENEQYDEAYELLYPEFKENYFPTINSFIEYAQKTFPEMATIEHENIERNGDVYVLWINIIDALNGKPGEEKKMNIVIKENDYNDIVMSFSVI